MAAGCLKWPQVFNLRNSLCRLKTCTHFRAGCCEEVAGYHIWVTLTATNAPAERPRRRCSRSSRAAAFEINEHEREIGRRDPAHAAGLPERSRPDPRVPLGGLGAKVPHAGVVEALGGVF